MDWDTYYSVLPQKMTVIEIPTAVSDWPNVPAR